MKSFIACALASLAALAACFPPPVGEAVNGPVPRERAAECEANCGGLGMRLASVVLIMNSAGCVCVPVEGPPGAPGPAVSDASASASAGGAMIAVQMAAQAAARQRRNNHH